MGYKWDAFEQYVARVMEENHIAGAAVAVSVEGEVSYARGFGVRDIETGELVTPQSVFGVASVSKSFTSLAINQLADAGLLSIDDPVTKYVPELVFKGCSEMSEVKIRHILSHSTGLPPMTRRQNIMAFADHVEFLNGEEYELLGPPGEYYSYANDTFLLDGQIIERLTGQVYRRYMTQHILDAIGMHRSTYNLEELEKMGNVTVPYNYNKKNGALERQVWPVLGTYEVGGGVRSNVLDLMKYAAVYLNGGVALNGWRLVSEDAINRMCTPIVQVGRKSFYCLGLQTTPDYHGVTLVEHGGSQPGVSSNFGFVPRERIACAVLTNVGGVPAGAIWLAAMNTALGFPMDRKRSIETEWLDVPLGYLERFAGTYSCNEGGKITVTVDKADGTDQPAAARILANGEEFKLSISDERTLFYQAPEQQMVVRFFFRDGEEKPWAALAGSRMLRREK